MIYVRVLELVNEDNETIFRARNQKATVALGNALRIIQEKDNPKVKEGILKKFLFDLNKEFEDYFRI